MDYVNGPGRNHLFVPGPVNIPEQVIRAMSRNNEDYRAPAIPALTKALLEDVKQIFKTTSGTPFLFPTTGADLLKLLVCGVIHVYEYTRFSYVLFCVYAVLIDITMLVCYIIWNNSNSSLSVTHFEMRS